MTTLLPPDVRPADSLEETPAQHHPCRWRLNRGGIVNIWFYFDSEFSMSGGRVIWRGTNGAGKSRALEMLLPFLLDADRRKIDATGGGKVRLEDLMKAGGADQANRLGYLWLELAGLSDDGEPEYLTLGALVRFSQAAAEARIWYFVTPLRVGPDLVLLDEQRLPLSRDALADLVGADRITDSPEAHRERVRSSVFALTGEAGRERYAGLLQLLHTLRSPDVGNRIEEGKLPAIVSEALPPLSESSLNSAGEQLDALSETRASQQRIDQARAHVAGFLDIYRRYTAGVLVQAAESARAAAAADRAAAGEAHDAAERHGALVAGLSAVRQQLAVLGEAEAELNSTISGIKESKRYESARDLDEREKQVKALGGAADGSLRGAAAARKREGESADDAGSWAGDLVAAAHSAAAALGDARRRLDEAAVSGTLAAEVAAIVSEPLAVTDVVRTARDSEPGTVTRPAVSPVELVPDDPAKSAAQVRAVKGAAEARAGQAAHRHAVATDLAAERARMELAEQRAGEAQEAAEEADRGATEAADQRDDEAVALALGWQRWAADSTSTALLGPVDWAETAVGPLLADIGVLAGADGDSAVLPVLDAAADAAATPARDRLADRNAAVRAAQAEADLIRETLEAEQVQLRAARDPEPARAPWHTNAPEGRVPLWRAADFAAAVPAADRAGVEAALQASGLLTATLGDGSLTAADGQVLIAPAGPVAASSLAAVLVPDPASPADPAAIASVLARIAFGDRRHPVWVDRDGAWGNGPLTGRHRSDVARHIGAQARAEARAVRLAEIATLLSALDADDERRAEDLRAIGEQRKTLSAHVQTAPRSSNLASLRSVAADQRRRAEAAAAKARALLATARLQRTAWHGKNAAHEAACASARLPTTPQQLASVRAACETASRACEKLADQLAELAGRADRYRAAAGRAVRAAEDRAAEEDAADRDWLAWHSAEAEFAALRENVGREAAQVRAELRAAEDELAVTTEALDTARGREKDLGAESAAAERDVMHARGKAEDARANLRKGADDLRRIVALPGVAAAALSAGMTADVSLAEVTPAAVDAAARSVVAAVDRRGSAADENTLIRGQQALERDLSGTFDVVPSVSGGVRLVELADATGRQHLADAAAQLTRRAEEGRSALSERERRVFTDFVVGGVAEELRRRLGQASRLIDAMNASLATIRTSHGIGVKVRWALSEGSGSQIARVRELVTVAGEVRTAEQTAELTELIKDQVDVAFGADATAGYAVHLKAALDYRAWHAVEVIILGPEPGQERRISRRTKLSQGETRFVSYLALFAAVDAYLSGLPDTGRALRLILLDDAFAKVDDRTIAELMGLLVRLDIDFAMTGHALWGCYPQVPALDVYEVRRRDGTAAVTTHVHWDGRNRHLRAAR